MKRFAVGVLLLGVAILVGCGRETAPKKAATPSKPGASPSFTPSAGADKNEAPEPRDEKLAPPAPPGREKAAGEEKAVGEAPTAEEKKPAEEPKAVVEKKAAVEEKE